VPTHQTDKENIFPPSQSFLVSTRDKFAFTGIAISYSRIYTYYTGHKLGLIEFEVNNKIVDRLCGLVIRALGYRSRDTGSIPGANTFLEK
jgi:hypothetical protein